MTYKEMVELASARGHGSEHIMHESVDHISEMMCKLKEYDEQEYWKFMREQHEIIYDGHYSPEFAELDLQNIHWIGKDGQKHNGPHWTQQEVLDATKGMPFPSGTTDCDKYVAFNSFYSDMCKDMDETSLIKMAHRYFFNDDDAPSGKIWWYMKAMCQAKEHAGNGKY